MKILKTEGKNVYLTKENCPTKCGSWNPNKQPETEFNFTLLKELWDESHDQFRLYRCETCETYYLWHWHEEIGCDGGGDSVSICARSITDADRIAMRFFEEHGPFSDDYRKFLHARVTGFWSYFKWPD